MFSECTELAKVLFTGNTGYGMLFAYLFTIYWLANGRWVKNKA